MNESNYPRMLFRGDETSRADSRDELLAKRAQGWRATLLPGEEPADIGEQPAPDDNGLNANLDVAAADSMAPPTRGRPKKSAE